MRLIKVNPESHILNHFCSLVTFPYIKSFIRTHTWFLSKSKSKSSLWRWSINKVFFKISQNLRENTCARVSDTLARMFPVNFAKFSIKTSFYRTTLDECFCLLNFMYVQFMFFVQGVVGLCPVSGYTPLNNLKARWKTLISQFCLNSFMTEVPII